MRLQSGLMSAIRFEILARSGTSQARLGRVETVHGGFDTPAFMPVGTRGSVKGLFPRDVARAGSQIVLNNTYHLLLRPGPELVASMGGVHRFMNWDGPILTDSGGYQAYSMSDVNAVDDDGVTFKSIVDGSDVRLTPERAIEVQNKLGADIIMAFDDCPPAKAPEIAREPDGRGPDQGEEDPRLVRAVRRDSGKQGYDHQKRLEIANERTVRWLERCKRAHARSGEQALFGIVQGGTDLARREWSASRVCGVDLPGYAIGGVAVGEPSEEIARIVRHTAPLLPVDKPRYLMGVGYERDLLAAVLAGMDMFDCVLPTRNGRNANAFTSRGQIRLRNARYAEDRGPIEEGCDCAACDPGNWWGGWCGEKAQSSNRGGGVFSRGYLRHLFMVGEMLGPILVSLHNIRHFQRFMRDVRGAIATDGWDELVRKWPVAAAGR
ncbi:MAG: tRNA guanosine(34) transglycosylase Tgt [Phycisphaerales bacterium]|nr:tRNA guanosine(34) transglycosylase Tgt [Phycisphaerales bacterium]